MTSAAIVTMTKMMETLPETVQDQALAQLREYIAELQAEKKWDELFSQTQNGLIAAAKQARKEIAAGQAKPMGFDRL
ncbi:MAG: hypothetical protein KDE53_22420 [Caldilineaceae bacterium]|nr:hypothetical protein [Caldilineaceae bacterium]MCB0126613.1 hypothetical protein [Caldilineaceae bacterium]